MDLSDQALRQRLTQARRHLAQAGWLDGKLRENNGDLAFGAIRSALLPLVGRTQPHFASHDPDGHLFAIGAHKSPMRGNKGAIQSGRRKP